MKLHMNKPKRKKKQDITRLTFNYLSKNPFTVRNPVPFDSDVMINELFNFPLTLGKLTSLSVSMSAFSNGEPRWLSRYSDSLWAGRSTDRIPIGGGASFLSRVLDLLWDPPSLLYGDRVKRPARDSDHTLQFSAEVKEKVELYLYSLSGRSRPVLEWTSLTLSDDTVINL
jgi:hypothetical protein